MTPRRRSSAPSRGAHLRRDVDLTTTIGSVTLPNPVMTASGTAGHGAELAAYLDLASLGAVVVKSLKAEPWAGNPAPRVHEVAAGMINSVGLQGPGVEAWLTEELPALLSTGARVVASIWGTTVAEYEKAAAMLRDAPASVVAVEVNLSCPNTMDPVRHGGGHPVGHGGGHPVRHGGGSRRAMFAHDAVATEEAIAASAACDRPRWAKLSPNVTDLVPIADAARRGGAEAVTLVNTVLGMAIDPHTRRYRLGAGSNGGGVSGPAIHPIAVRAVHDVHAALPDLPIVGVGGVVDGPTAAELLLAGASAVQVGTATFADPRAPASVLAGLRRWLDEQGEHRVRDVIGAMR